MQTAIAAVFQSSQVLSSAAGGSVGDSAGDSASVSVDGPVDVGSEALSP